MKGAAWRVGLFALVGLALLAFAIVLAGAHWFVPREGAVMRFGGSVYGLQVGSPVLFRGVRVGQVSAVDLAPPATPGQPVAIEVHARFERALLRQLLGADKAAEGAPGTLIPALVARGLVARLATQSLLTGQLYVNLDVDAGRVLPVASQAGGPAADSSGATAGAAPGAAPGAGAGATTAAAPAPAGGIQAAVDPTSRLPIIPTGPTPLQSMQAQFESLDLAQIGRDLSALTASLRQLMAGPEPARLLSRAADAAQSLERLAVRLEREVAPLSRSAQGALGEGQRAATQVGRGADQLGQSAAQVAQQVAGAASAVQSQVQALGGAGSAALVQVQRSAEVVAQAAESLRATVADDSTLRLNSERALQDVSKAARALRELAELLERHPEALLRGRAGNTP